VKFSFPQIFDRAGIVVGAFLGGMRKGSFRAQSGDSWEGWQTSRHRTRPSRRNQSLDFGLDYGIRECLASEYRDLLQKFPIVGNITRKFARYCVGTCEPVWNTGDPKVDAAYKKYAIAQMKIADANGEDHFIDQTKQIVGDGLIGMGDGFAQMLDANGFGQLRLIESDRIGNYLGGSVNIDEPNVIGGIVLNRNGNGRRLAARVWQRMPHGYVYENPQDVPWADIIHVISRERPDSIRGVTRFAPVLNTLRDLKETKEDEQLAAKIYSRIVLHAKMRNGAAGGSSGIQLQEGDGDTPGSRPGGTGKPDLLDVAPGTWFFSHKDEELSALIANRPTAGWQWLMEFMIAEVAMALDLPFSVAWKMAGLPGPAVRFELTSANRTFQDVIGTLNRRWYPRVYGWWIAKGIKAGRIPFNPNWYQFSVIQPSSITIDLGRESKIGLEEIDAGAGTITAYVGESGETFEDVIDRRGYEESKVIEAAKKYGVDPEAIRRPTQTAAMVSQQEQQAQAAKESKGATRE
jgi:hypothetical protein